MTRKKRETKKKEKKKTTNKNEEVEITITTNKEDIGVKIVHWSARMLGILIAVFWFAILLTHGFSMATMLESIVLISVIAVLICAWKFEFAGGMIYLLLGITYMIVTISQANWTAILIVATPPIVTGGLFITESMKKVTD